MKSQLDISGGTRSTADELPEGFRYEPELIEPDDEAALLARVLRMRRKVREKKSERASVEAGPRSAYLLSGLARREWEHSISAVDALRYSITFRNLREG